MTIYDNGKVDEDLNIVFNFPESCFSIIAIKLNAQTKIQKHRPRKFYIRDEMSTIYVPILER